MRKVLVVDDSAVARVTLKKRIEARGVTVESRESVADCATLDGRAYDAVLLDFDLGDGTGDTVAARLRATAPDLPIAFFTSQEDAPSLDAARSIGPVFAKPELDRAVDWLCGAKR